MLLAACRPASPTPRAVPFTVDSVHLDPGALGAIERRGLVPSLAAPVSPGVGLPAPEHVRLTIGTGGPTGIEVAVYPLAAFAHVLPEEHRAEAEAAATELETLLAERPADVEAALLAMRGLEADAPRGHRGREIPRLPFDPTPRTFQILTRFLDLPPAAGVRFVGHDDFGVGPVVSGELAYVFQGMSPDRRWWITARAPLVHDALPASYDDAVARGIYREPTLAQDYGAYLDELLASLEADAEGFRPSLEDLDTMVRSIRVRP